MPTLNDMFPSKYLKAADFDEAGSVLTIKELKPERIGQGKDADDKWVVYFAEVEKGLVMNKTNSNIIAKLYGDDTDDWEGKKVTLYATEVQFQGDMVDAIRVKSRVPKPAAKPAKPVKAAAKTGSDEMPDEDDDDLGSDGTPF